jgi:hypothetical protein
VKKFVLFVLLLAVLFAVSVAQTQSLQFKTVNLRSDCSTPPTIHYYCSLDYANSDCLKDSLALCHALAPYPTSLLGDWSYYLVMADDWKPLVRSGNGNNANTISPAFSLLLGRATVMDRSLFSPTPERAKELEVWSGLPRDVLLGIAVTHEMGHALCQEKNERKANDYGKELRDGKIPDCSKTPGWKPSTDLEGATMAAEVSPHGLATKRRPRIGLPPPQPYSSWTDF